jgi:hypothetical protein
MVISSTIYAHVFCTKVLSYFCQSQNVPREKLPKALLYKKVALKMLMKLTPSYVFDCVNKKSQTGWGFPKLLMQIHKFFVTLDLNILILFKLKVLFEAHKSALKLQKILQICLRSFVNPHPGAYFFIFEKLGRKAK